MKVENKSTRDYSVNVPLEAWILNVGSELTLGVTVNTNGTWLARKLSFLGFAVRRILCVPDDREVVDVLKDALNRSVPVIVVTGGLGPTHDDRTLEFVAEALGRKLQLNEKALQLVKGFYEKEGMSLTEERVKMALMPEGARPIANPVGAAPGCIVESGRAVIICLPGVPKEMQSIFEQHVEILLKKMLPSTSMLEACLSVEGVPESSIAPHLKKIVRENPRIYVKSHPLGHELRGPQLKVHLMMRGGGEAEEALKRVIERIQQAVAELGGTSSLCD